MAACGGADPRGSENDLGGGRRRDGGQFCRAIARAWLQDIDGRRQQAALAHVDSGARFDLLFTDVIMPGGMNGRELADQVAKSPARNEDSLHVRLHRGRHCSSRPLDPGVLLLANPIGNPIWRGCYGWL